MQRDEKLQNVEVRILVEVVHGPMFGQTVLAKYERKAGGPMSIIDAMGAVTTLVTDARAKVFTMMEGQIEGAENDGA